MQAPGGPGAPSSLGPGRKQAFGSAPGPLSKVWYTIADGNLTECFFPTIDRPALRGLRFLAAAPGSPPVDDAAEAEHAVRWLLPGVPSFTVESRHHEYSLRTEYCSDPDLNALLISGDYRPELPDIRLFLQWSPHLRPGSGGNDAQILHREPPVLVARQADVWIAVVGPFTRASAGYLNSSDLFVDLHDNDGKMTAFYELATGGNVALGAELGVRSGPFQLAIGFAHSRSDAEELALEALHKGFGAVRDSFDRAWRLQPDLHPHVLKTAGDGGDLARASVAVLRCLEDKTHAGGFVASPAAPWGERQSDGSQTYQLVWTRDAYHITTALLEAGDPGPAQRALRFLERAQLSDGSWPQNFTLDGSPHWLGQELDEVAMPILLAWRLGVAGALDHDPYPALVRAAGHYLITHGPSTQLDRWEDDGGISPSTLAVSIAALLAAAEFADDAGEHLASRHLRTVADHWNDHVEAWCYLRDLQHYVRLAPNAETPPSAGLAVGVEFLELVRYGIRAAADPRIISSLKASDAVLRVDTPRGIAWRRYAGDNYGESDRGDPWVPAAVDNPAFHGRAWPLLTGERAFHALALGRPTLELVESIESFAGPELMVPEQVWDGEPVGDLRPGEPTGSASPLGWAHAEYLSLLAATAAGRLPDLVEPAVRRYQQSQVHEPPYVWTRGHMLQRFTAGRRVQVQLDRPGSVFWTADSWVSRAAIEAVDTTLGVWVAELPTAIMRPGAVMEWTAQYAEAWEGQNYALTCTAAED